jgi:antitoxin MazE
MISFWSTKEADMQISRWGKSLAVRLPKKLVERLGIAEGDDVDVTSEDAQTIVISKSDSKGDFLLKLRVLQKPKPEGFVWNRDDANSR